MRLRCSIGLYIFDVDGCVSKHGENNFIPGVITALKRIQEAGHQIIITKF